MAEHHATHHVQHVTQAHAAHATTLSPGPAFFKWSMGPPTTRYDFADVDAYVREHSAHVPAAQLDVYAGYWLTGWSITALAELDGITPRTVKKRIIRLRHRVRRWVARQRPQRTR